MDSFNKNTMFVCEILQVNSLDFMYYEKLNQVFLILKKIAKNRKCFVGGGFACFVCGRTNNYSDIDIFM